MDAFNVTYWIVVDPSYIFISCYARDYDQESPLFTRLIKDGVEEPIISAKFYGFYDGLEGDVSEETMIDNYSCYSTFRFDEKGIWQEYLLPCYSSCELKVNDDFWWCGFIAYRCIIDPKYETNIEFSIKFSYILPYIYVGNYTCQIEQNGAVRNSTFSIEKGILT